MNSSMGHVILDLAQKRISVDSFVSMFGADPRSTPDVIRIELEQALAQRSPDNVEYAIILGSIFGLSPTYAGVLCKLLEEDWHYKHEDIADALQDICAPDTVECLYRTANRKFAYLEYNDGFALARKCMWALHDIGTNDAVSKLSLLAASDSEAISECARKKLLRLATKKPNEPDAAYRQGRNRRLRADGL